MDIHFRLKANFFDRPKVIRKMTEARRRALSKVGAFVRQRARTSIRKRKGISLPGMPPSSHEGSLRKLIMFEYDSKSDSVVIGPWPLRKFTGVPRLLELGGTRQRITKAGFPYVARYLPRPYMQPALYAEIAAGTIGRSFRGSFR